MMDLQILESFFMWCTIINGGIYIIWLIFVMLAPDFVYRVQNAWFPIARETYNVIIFSFFGLFKIFFIFFNVVPYVALLIIK